MSPQRKREPRWAWCPTCKAWVGSKPPFLPLYWSNEKAAGLHLSGCGHKCWLMTMREILEP